MDTPQSPLPPTQVQPAPQMPVMPAKKSRKWLWISLVVLTLAAVSAALAYTQSLWPFAPTETPSPSPTASTTPATGLKIYTNSQLGISFQYPDTWQYQIANTDPLDVQFSFTPAAHQACLAQDQMGCEGTQFEMTAVATARDADLQAYWNRTNNKTVTFGGYQFSIRNIQNFGAWYLIQHNGYTIAFNSQGIDYTPQILSTFTFTTSTVGWKTYTNTQYGFELKYPSEYKIVSDFNADSWSHAIILLYNGGQIYDIAVEIWNSPADYQNTYDQNPTLIQKVGSQYITLTNLAPEEGPTNEQIISTFTFTVR